MLDAETIRFIRNEIRVQMASIGHGIVRTDASATIESQALEQNYPGGPKMLPRPVAHPYGFVSRAPDGMLAVTGRIGEHPGAIMTIGHRDPARTGMDVALGESAVYSLNQHGVWARTDKTQVGSSTADNPVVLGTELMELITAIVDVLIAGSGGLTTSPGNPTAPNPAVVSQFAELKSRLITAVATNILSTTVFTTKTGGA